MKESYKVDDIAIIGMSARLPRANDFREFWRNLIESIDCITGFPQKRVEELNNILGRKVKRVFKDGGYLDSITLFEPEIFSISQEESKYIDPQQRLLLELVEEAILDAGYNPLKLSESSVGTFIAHNINRYTENFKSTTPLAYVNSVNSCGAGRIAYTYNFKGPAVTIGTACSSSLVSIHEACKSIMSGEVDIAIAGGAVLNLIPGDKASIVNNLLTEVTSVDQKTRAFDKNADGFVEGEGGGVLILKALNKAYADRDYIHAVIKGSAVNSDGSRSNGLASPSSESQAELILKAIKRSGIDPLTISYIETHGTGTKLGDPIEIAGISSALNSLGVKPQTVAIGSVKTNIGHLDTVAGIASVIKTVLMLKNGEIPPLLHFKEPNPLIEFEGSPVYINDELSDWNVEGPRRAGVTSLGLIGTNCHMIIEENCERVQTENKNCYKNFITLSARTENSLREIVNNLAVYLDGNRDLPIDDIAYTLNCGRRSYKHKFIITSGSTTELADELNNFAREGLCPGIEVFKQKDNEVSAVFIYPDIGSADFGGIKNLYEEEYNYRVYSDEFTEKYSGYDAGNPGVCYIKNLYLYSKLFELYSVRPKAVFGIGAGDIIADSFTGQISLEQSFELISNYSRNKTAIDAEKLTALIDNITESGINTFLLFCPDKELAGIFKKVASEKNSFDLFILNQSEDEFYSVIKKLVRNGLDINWDNIYKNQNSNRLSLPGYVFDRRSYYLEVEGRLEIMEPSARDYQAGQHNSAHNTVIENLKAMFGEICIDDYTLDSYIYDLNITSLNIMQFIAKIKRTYNVDISIKYFFEGKTLGQTFNIIEDEIKHAATGINIIKRQPEREYYPVSAAQKRIYILNQLYKNNTGYNVPFAFDILGELDIEKLEKVFKRLIKRHDAFRTVFEVIDGQLVQKIHDEVDFSINSVEISKGELAIKQKEFVKPFALDKAPLLRVELAKLSTDRHFLFIDTHHIIFDGTSNSILVNDLIKLYSDFELPGLRIQYKDFAVWQNELFKTDEFKRQEDFWLKEFEGEIPVLNLPTDFPRPSEASLEGDNLFFELNKELAESLKKLTSSTGTTLYMLLLAAYNVLLFKYTGQEDIIVGSPIAGRSHADLDKIVGVFVNTIALRCYPNGSKSFRQFLEEVKLKSLGAFENQDYPFEMLVEKLGVDRDVSRNALFDTLFAMQNIGDAELYGDDRKEDTLKISPLELENKVARFDLDVHAYEINGTIGLKLEYCTKLFKRETIERVSEHFVNLLERIAENIDVKLSDIEIISEEEKKHLLVDFNNTLQDFPEAKTAVDLFEEQVYRTPDKVAVIYKDMEISYRELDVRTNQLANYLIAEVGVVPDFTVGIIMDQSHYFVIAVLGIMKAGGAYIPIDPAQPEERIKSIIKSAGITSIISIKQYVDLLNKIQWGCSTFNTYICIDSEDIYSDTEAANISMDETLWEYVGENADDDIAGGGWISSYTGEKFSEAEMKEYADNISEKLMPYLNKETKVLEIGCASGISMFRLAPHVRSYFGTDLSGTIIEYNRKKILQAGIDNIELACIPAHEIHKLGENKFDVIVLNSVIHCFHSHNYLRQVIKKAINLLNNEGMLFLGDLMDQDLKDNLIQSLLDFKEKHINCGYRTTTDYSMKLFVSKDYLRDLSVDIKEIRNISFSQKIHTIENELTRFRYDAIVEVDKRRPNKPCCMEKIKKQHSMQTLERFGSERIKCAISPDNALYIIYTSGTTGQPKGMTITHRNLVNYVTWFTNTAGLTNMDKSVLLSSACFDLAYTSLFPSILNGCELHLVPKEMYLDPACILNYMSDNEITFIKLTPSLFGIIVNSVAFEKKSVVKTLRLVVLGGEQINTDDVEKFNGSYPKTQVMNHYGPTETTIGSIATFIDFDKFNEYKVHPVIGKPINNVQVYILNKYMKLLPVGVCGEIYISGEGVGREYFGSPRLSKEKFLPNPFLPDKRVYKTGDFARWLPGGNIEFFGRVDNQVKIRGYRIETEEIKSVLLTNRLVKSAVVVDREDSSNGRYLCAYYVSESDMRASELKEYLSERLPDYMVPSYIIKLDNIPLTLNGKVDIKALTDPGKTGDAGEGYVAPETATEKALYDIWKGILGLDIIGVNDNFFEIGGHSLKATILMTNIHKVFNVEIPLADIFNSPTIRELSHMIDNNEASQYMAIEVAEEKEYYEVTYSQRRIFIASQFNQASIHNNMPIAVVIEGNIDMKAFEEALGKLVKRHDPLRTSFYLEDGEPVQRIHKGLEINVEYTDASAEDDEKIKEIVNRFVRPFNLCEAPLMRVGLIKLGEKKHIFIYDLHHIISDGTSRKILLEDFSKLYMGIDLPQLRIQYKDFSQWQNKLFKTEYIKRVEEYWLNTFKGEIPVLDLPTDYPRPPVQDFKGDIFEVSFDRDISDKLRDFAAKTETTLYMVMLAGFNVLFSKYSGQEDIVIGSPVAGRQHADLQNIMGIFINMLPMRNYPSGDKTYMQFLLEVKENSLKAFANQSYQYEMLLDKLNVKKDLSRTPLLDIVFNMLNMYDDTFSALSRVSGGDLKFSEYPYEYKATRFDLTMIFGDSEENIRGICNYRTSLFKRATIEYMLKEFMDMLREIVDNPNKKLREYGIFQQKEIVEEEANTPVQEQWGVDKQGVNRSIVKRFEYIEQMYPHNIAVKTSEKELTYKALNQSANVVAGAVSDLYKETAELSKSEKIRYSRQLLLDGWGVEGQEKLKNATVFVAGAGGSGSPLIYQLALCGVGNIIVCDFDDVELSNLNRQFLHDESRIGMNKAISAKLTIGKVNPNVNVIPITEKITRENVFDIVGDSAIIFDNIDELDAKFILSECAVAKGIPHIISSMIEINSYAAIFHAPLTPCFHCLYDRDKLKEIENIGNSIKSSYSDYRRKGNPVSAPSLFLSTGFVCNEAVKIILGLENPAYNRYFLFNQKASDKVVNTHGHLAITFPFSRHFREESRRQGYDWDKGWNGNFVEEIKISQNPDCPVCTQKNISSVNINVPLEKLNKAGRLADTKAQSKLIKNKTIALLFEHGADMVVGILGVLKSGNIYVPLDPLYPEERLSYILEDSESKMILTNNKNLGLAEKLAEKTNRNIQVLNIEALDVNILQRNIDTDINPEHSAYILYTSGSTGRPKGVIQNHRNVLHYIRCYTDHLNIRPADRLSLLSSYSHDAAIVDIFSALLNGATLCPYSIKEKGIDNLSRWLEDTKITIYHSIPTVFRYFTHSLRDGRNVNRIRMVVLGGELTNRTDVELYRRYFSDRCIFVNLYGASEASIAAMNLIDKETEVTGTSVPLGVPIDGMEVELLNESTKEVLTFGTGEIVLKSDYLAQGYWNLPEETEEAFINDPVTGVGRVYKSGDLGRRLLNGNVEYVGRNDSQIKIRGYRVELSEIEAVLDSIEGIKKSAVVFCSAEGEEGIIAAYYVENQGVGMDESSIREYLGHKLLDYMIPSVLVPLESFPATPGGKIDRKALSKRNIKIEGDTHYVPPETETQEKLLRMWSEILGVYKIGIYDNFFRIGGHSLKAMNLMAKVNREFNVEIPIVEIFNCPTIYALANMIDYSERKQYVYIEPAEEKDYYVASAAQKRMYILNSIDKTNVSYNMSFATIIEGSIDSEVLENSFRSLVERHDSLRTSFHLIDGECMQKIHKDVSISIDYQVYNEDSIENTVKKFIRPFDLSIAPLFRIALIDMKDNRSLLIIDMHHIISDATSVSIMVRELAELYNKRCLPGLRVQYKDYSEWQRRFLTTAYAKKQEEYWLSVFSGEIPELNLPIDYPRPDVQSFEGSRIEFSIDMELTEKLKAMASDANATLYMLLLAAYNILLSRCTGQEDIIVGSPIAGRANTDLENIIGLFVNTLAIRSFPEKHLTFKGFLEDVRKTTLMAYENQEYQFESLIEKLGIKRNAGRNPLFDTMFVLQNMDFTAAEIEAFKFIPYKLNKVTSKFDLSLTVVEHSKIISFTFEYCTKLFNKCTIDSMAADYMKILNSIIYSSDIRIKDIALETEGKYKVYKSDINTEIEFDF